MLIKLITSVLGYSEKPEVAIIALPNEWRTVTPSIKSAQLSCNDHCPCHLPQYTLAEVSEHYHEDNCWIVLYDKVYDVTKFIKEHPGGDYIITENAGRDATLAFRGSRHGKDVLKFMEKFCIGILVPDERLYDEFEST